MRAIYRRIFVLALAVCSLILWTGLASRPVKAQTKTKINPKDGAVMVYVSAGEFLMGSTKSEVNALMNRYLTQYPDCNFDNETPQHKVTLDGYWIYKNDVTVAQYRKFCKAIRHKMPPEPDEGWKDNHPIVNVSWYDAVAYCQWAGVRLPTESEWEKAARGTDGRIFPWGSEFDSRRLWWINSAAGNVGGTAPVGSYPSGRSPYGCLDMAGNVWQWCADRYDGNYYKRAPERNPQGSAVGTSRVLRGGSWYNGNPYVFRAAGRHRCSPVSRDYFFGFRCASSR